MLCQFLLFSSVQLLSCVQLFATPWTAARQASLSITNSHSLLRLMSIELVMPSNHLILCCPRLLPPSTFLSIRVFSNESVHHIKWPRSWSFSSSKASVLWSTAFFIFQLSHPYMTTGKTIALIRWTFVGKVMSLLFYMLSSLVIAFLPRSKCLNFLAALTICSDFGAPQNKVSHCFHCFPIYLL